MYNIIYWKWKEVAFFYLQKVRELGILMIPINNINNDNDQILSFVMEGGNPFVLDKI